MIRNFCPDDVPQLMQIWLNGNLQAHSFIPAEYWTGHFNLVKELLPKAELLVYENEETHAVEGFLGLTGEEIAGLFVAESARSKGVGAQLLAQARVRRASLTLHVYQANTRALHFYFKQGFQIETETVDEDTGEQEFIMFWKSKPVLSDFPK